MSNVSESQNPIVLIEQPITLAELKKIAEKTFGDMVKAVVDIEGKAMAVGGELHADEEAFLLERGSQQLNLWGINIYVDKPTQEWIEFDSMINIRPSQGNRSRFIEDENIRKIILDIANNLIKE